MNGITFDWNNIINVAKTFGFFDFVDVLIVTYIVYKGIQFAKNSRAGQLVKGIAILIIVAALAQELDLKTTSYILSQVFSFGVIAIIVVFQPELRRMLESVGKSKLSKFPIFNYEKPDEATVVRRAIKRICDGVAELSKAEVGALIVFERETKLGEIIATGTIINADPSKELVGNLFFHNAPLHDGALIVRAGRLYAAGCFLPLSENYDISNMLGTRHRAALGMSENSDAVVVVVSEETGIITMALDGKLIRELDPATLRRKLEMLLITEKQPEEAQTGTQPEAQKESEEQA